MLTSRSGSEATTQVSFDDAPVWLGRYAERAEAARRILRTSDSFLKGEEPLTPELRAYLLQVIAEATSTPVMNVPPTDSDMTRQLLEGPVHNAIGNMLNSMLFCADEAKELLTSDTYRVINDIRDTIPALSISQPSGMMSPEDVLNPLVTALMALSGLSHESMVRGYGWRFLEIGRRLERAMQSAALISGLLGPVLPEPEQSRITEALLLIMEGLISYRRRHGARIALQTGLDLELRHRHRFRTTTADGCGSELQPAPARPQAVRAGRFSCSAFHAAAPASSPADT